MEDIFFYFDKRKKKGLINVKCTGLENFGM